MHIDFRTLKGKIHGGLLYFLSFYAIYELLFQPYDSDKWVWVISGILVGITMAFLHPFFIKISEKEK